MGKKGSDAPDYTPMANASKEAAQIMAGLGQDQLDFSKQMYNENKPMLEKIANSQLAAQQEQLSQGRDYYDYMKDTFRPVEQQLVTDAQNFNTRAYQEQMASKAAADAGLAFGQTQAMNQRSMAAMGVNPASGRFAGMNAGSTLQQAAQRAGAMTNARQGAEQLGHARMLDAAGLGRGLSGASTAAYNSATGAGSAGANTQQMPGQAYLSGMASGASTIGSGQSMQLQGLGSVLNAQTQTFAANPGNSFMGDLGGVLGGIGSIYTFSDRRLKENIVEVGVDQRTALPLYEFNYRGDSTRRFVGVMADEVQLSYPDAVSEDSNGFLMVNYAALGIEFKEVS